MNLVIEKPEPDGTVRVDIGHGPTRHPTTYVVQVLEDNGLAGLAASLGTGEWIDVAITRSEQIDALSKALG
jgi:hypothetical protein